MFELFTTRPYTFLKLESILGDRVIQEEYESMGVIKLNNELGGDDSKETELSPIFLYIKPTEHFITLLGRNMVGQGIRIEGEDYRIQKQVDGFDFDLGKIEFYKLSLQREAINECQSELPLI